MRLSAFYFEETDYLFDTPQILNLGGQYNYQFQNLDEASLQLIINKNDNFIEGFFNLTEGNSYLSLFSAIVGKNGAGKSTILNLLRGALAEDHYNYGNSGIILIFEDPNNHANVFIVNNSNKNIQHNEYTFIENITHINNDDFGTLYYAPHFDLKTNIFNNDTHDDFSVDYYLKSDLDNAITNDNVLEELMYKNSRRHIQFLSSSIVKENPIFSELFQLQNYNEFILKFQFKEKERDWNTPTQFRGVIKEIIEQSDRESAEWHIRRDVDKYSQVEIFKYLLKYKLLSSVVSNIISVMEIRNSYLQEGYLDEVKLDKEKPFAFQLFEYFILNAKIKSSKSERSVFPNKTPIKLVQSVISILESISEPSRIDNSYISVSAEQAIDILKAQNDFIRELQDYYYLFNNEVGLRDEHEKVNSFITYVPFGKNLSSGEISLLNLFSNLYEFIERNLKIQIFKPLKEHYILIMDEPDLAMHPSWKRQFVYAICKTIPHFFNEITTWPSLQIIFTTHEPFTLSDIPNQSVVYLDRPSYEFSSSVLDLKSDNRPQKTFAANISDLLADSFFLSEGFIGRFAQIKIDETIEWINSNERKRSQNYETELEYYKRVISTIDERVIKLKLAEMLSKIESDNEFYKKTIDDGIYHLRRLKSELE